MVLAKCNAARIKFPLYKTTVSVKLHSLSAHDHGNSFRLRGSFFKDTKIAFLLFLGILRDRVEVGTSKIQITTPVKSMLT